MKTLDYNKPDAQLKPYFNFRHDGKHTYRNVLSMADRSSNVENLEKFKDCIEENENNGLREIRRVARLKKAGEVPKIPKMEYVEFEHMWKEYIGKKSFLSVSQNLPPFPLIESKRLRKQYFNTLIPP